MKNLSKLQIIIFLIFAFVTGCNSQNEEQAEKKEDSELVAAVYQESPEKDQQDHDSADNSVNYSRRNAITNSVEKACPAVVGINITEIRSVQYRDPLLDDPFFRHFFGGRSRPRTRKYEVEGVGSGFIISPDGYILTNHHVAGNASKIVVSMTNGEHYDAEIIGADKVSDVALLKIKGKDFPYLKLGNSDDILTGEWVIAFGNPFGLFAQNSKPTVTVGVVSNTGINMYQEGRVYKKMIQTDAAISSGNSGGPLLNSLGEVIGMNTMIFSTAQNQNGAGSIGIGFSIPINRIKKIIDLLKKDKTINRQYVIGMDVRALDESIAKYFGLDRDDGVVVVNIYRKSPADKAGIEPGDVILKINGNKIMRDMDYLVAVNDGIVGQKLKFLILRNDELIEKTIDLVQIRN